MNNVVIACETLRDELNKALEETNSNYPVIWVASEYHIDPDRLRSKLQQEVDNLKGYDNILFAYGSCGNGVINLFASTANLVIPKTDDCISLVLTRPNEKFERRKKTYFLTKGWIESSKSIINEYSYTLNRYGEKRTERLFNAMLRNYDYLMLIDTGAYNLEEFRNVSDKFASKVNLQLITEKGQLWFLKKLLTGPYDKDFCVIEKNEKVTIEDFGYDKNSN